MGDERDPGRRSTLAPVLVPLAVALVLVWRGSPWAAALVAGVATVAFVAARTSPRAAALERRVVARVGHVVGRVLGVVLLGLVAVLVIWPVWLVARALRHDVLDRERGRWHVRAEGTARRHRPRRAYAAEAAREGAGAGRSLPVRVLRGVALAAGAVVLFLAVDIGLGYAWDHFVGSHDVPVALDLPGRDDTAIVPPTDRDHPMDPRYTEPAMAPYPWAEDYFREFSQLEYDYVAYLYPRVQETHGRFINSVDGIRRSYEPSLPAGREAPVLWFFGGSTIWGEGQRDRHTIASEVARIAEAEGLPVQVVNYGERGYVSWQEVQLFERALAHGPAPLQAIFYDGTNDLNVQGLQPSVDPTHFDYARLRRSMTGLGLGTGADADPTPSVASPTLRSDLADLFDRYVEVSAVAKIARRIEGLLGIQPAAAAEREPNPEEMIANAAGVYRRSQSVARLLAERDGVEPVFFWQPTRGGAIEGTGYDRLHDLVDDITVDLRASLVAHDSDDTVYLDGAHTNELGARLVAEAMWETLRPSIQAWYRDHREALDP